MKHRHAIRLLVLVIVLSLAAAGRAQRPWPPRVPDPAKGYTWQAAAKAARLSEAEIAALARGKVYVSDQAFKQVFTPYIESEVPLFITSDSLLNGFHVLYEESVLRLETVNRVYLAETLAHIWKSLRSAKLTSTAAAAVLTGARRRADVLIGTALRLLGEAAPGCTAEVAALIAAEVQRVTRATAHEKPAWLGKPDDAFLEIDYTRFRPRGFYTRSDRLKRYFRAVSWLQAIPLRVKYDEELLAALLIGRRLGWHAFDGEDRQVPGRVRRIFEVYQRFVGAPDDWDALRAAQPAGNYLERILKTGDFTRVRESLMRDARRGGGPSQINDQIRFAPTEPGRVAEAAFRVLSACRTPGGVLFTRTTDLRRFRRGLPSGLEIAILLGSKPARKLLVDPQKQELLAVLDRSGSLLRAGSLYCGYLYCLAALLDEPEPDAPAFMNSDAWVRKSVQTALAGWAQLRHTWVLHAKLSVTYACASMLPAGFVEPEPEFFGRMATLVETTIDALEEAGALTFETTSLAAELRTQAGRIGAIDWSTVTPENMYKVLESSVGEVGEDVGTVMYWLMRDVERDRTDEKLAAEASRLRQEMARQRARLPDEAATRPSGEEAAVALEKRAEAARLRAIRQWLATLRPRLAQMAAKLEAGGPLPAAVAERIRLLGMNLPVLWRRLARLCRRLEALAHKQLRKVPFSGGEISFLRNYGSELAAVMLYGGNSYHDPRDDAPRIVDVHSDPNSGRSLLVGIGRPRAIYVLYPVKGGEVLCRGAVMPYYEFAHPARLTDAEWKQRLSGPTRPKSPAWLAPILPKAGLTAPKSDGVE